MSTSAPQKNNFLLAFLGNPGIKYAATSHNAGFMLADFFHARHAESLGDWKKEKKHECEVSRGVIENKKIILCKPSTFMNLSGRAIQSLLSALNLQPSTLIVVSDDIDLPFGRLRIRPRGSAGGHNGLKSVIEHLRTENFIRLRIGVANNLRKKIPAEKFVLQRFNKDEMTILKETILPKAANALTIIITKGVEKAQQKYN